MQHLQVVRKVHQHRPRVHEIERPLREAVGADVVAEHFDVRSADLLEEAGLEIRRGHMPVRADLLGEPARDRAASAADLQASSTSRDGEPLDPPDRERVETLLEQLESARLVAAVCGNAY